MRCCVSGCKNDSRQTAKSQGITFHAFPTEPHQRAAWLQALGKEQWEPRERSAVCSDHFLGGDLYETRSGLRKVRAGARPLAAQDGPTSALQLVCRMCLSTGRRMFPITKYGLDLAYQHLTGLDMAPEDSLPRNVCFECAHRLRGSNMLRHRSVRAHDLMMDFLRGQTQLTIQNLKSIDPDSQISTTLNLKHFEPNHYDLILTDYAEPGLNESELKTNENSQGIHVDLEIKHETSNEIFLSEDMTENQDASGKEENIQSDLDVHFNLSDKDFSSDDSLPLERRKTKKKLVKKRSKTDKKPAKTAKKRQMKKDPNLPKVDRRRKPFLNDDLNETLFTITDLSFEEQIAEIQKRQESANYKNAVFKCTECFKGFLDEDAYNTHISRHTDQCGDHQCEICKTHFKHPHALRKHITAHHTQRFSCNQCPYVTTHRQTARLHERWHKGTKYQCPHCPDEFVKFTTYMGHIRIKHPSDFVCQLCGYSFVSEKGIDLHKKLKHRMDADEIPEDGPLCESCNIRFVSIEAYKQHLRVSARHTTNDKESRESNKPKKRKSKETKERERSSLRPLDKDCGDDPRRVYPSQIRKAEGPIPCEQCGMQLSDSRAYHGHFRRAHPDKNRTNYPSMKSPCMCEVCGRMFQSYALLKDHTWVHTGERPFKCDACGKSFRMKQRLVTHRRVHSQMKATYVCNLCGKHFSTHSNRQRHMFIHTGLKPYKCEMCGKCFKHASEKRAHITYVHLKKPWPKRARGKRRADSRQGMPPQPSSASGASEMDIGPSVWAACDPKMDQMGPMMDKNMYYNLKI